MRNFLRLAEKIDFSALTAQVYSQPELWNQYKVRYTDLPGGQVHKGIDDIVLRYNEYSKGEDYVDKVCSSIQVVDYPAWHKLTAAHDFIFALMTRVKGVHLGRCMISRLPPGGSIPLHSDLIPPAEIAFPDRQPPASYYERYHLVLQSAPGVVFRCRDEDCYMAPGEVWWFNNQFEHEVLNNSPLDRIHLICDIRTKHDDYIPG
jgi:hypothetical protein